MLTLNSTLHKLGIEGIGIGTRRILLEESMSNIDCYVTHNKGGDFVRMVTEDSDDIYIYIYMMETITQLQLQQI